MHSVEIITLFIVPPAFTSIYYQEKYEAMLYDILWNVMHVADFSKTLVSDYQTVWHHVSEYHIADNALTTCTLQVW
jgi:hypothetical protein